MAAAAAVAAQAGVSAVTISRAAVIGNASAKVSSIGTSLIVTRPPPHSGAAAPAATMTPQTGPVTCVRSTRRPPGAPHEPQQGPGPAVAGVDQHERPRLRPEPVEQGRLVPLPLTSISSPARRKTVPSQEPRKAMTGTLAAASLISRHAAGDGAVSAA